MLALRDGKRAALDSLVRRFERELFMYLKRYLGDAALADDVFQNTFLQVYLKRTSFDPSRRFKPWLYAIATNQAIDALRRTGRDPHVSLENLHDGDRDAAPAMVDPSPMEGAALSETRDLVRTAVESLPMHLKEVVLLAYFQGLKYRDVASVLSIPVGTVKSRLFAAVRLLQEQWGKPLATVAGADHGT